MSPEEFEEIFNVSDSIDPKPFFRLRSFIKGL